MVPAGALAGAGTGAGAVRAGRAGAAGPAAVPGGATAGGFELGIGAGAATAAWASPRARPASTGSVLGSGLLGEMVKLLGIGGTTAGNFPELLDLRLFAGDLPWLSSSLSELWPFLKGLCSLPPKSDLLLPLWLSLSLSSESEVSPFLKGLDSLSILLENREEKLFFLDDLPAESVSDMVGSFAANTRRVGCPGRRAGGAVKFAGHCQHHNIHVRICTTTTSTIQGFLLHDTEDNAIPYMRSFRYTSLDRSSLRFAAHTRTIEPALSSRRMIRAAAMQVYMKGRSRSEFAPARSAFAGPAGGCFRRKLCPSDSNEGGIYHPRGLLQPATYELPRRSVPPLSVRCYHPSKGTPKKGAN